MPAFAKQSKKPTTGQTTFVRPGLSGRGPAVFRNEVHPTRHYQQTIAHQAAQGMLDGGAGTDTRDSSGIPRARHDFGRIPILAAEAATARARRDASGASAGNVRGADNVAGKLGASLPAEGQWPEVTGGHGPKTSGAGAKAVKGAATKPPKLKKSNVSGPTANDCGGFDWMIQWELDKPTTKGGWVVQKVEVPYSVKDCSNKAVDPAKVGGLQPSWYPVWEAWQINKDQKVTTYAEGGDVNDDSFSTPGPGSDTKGTVTVRGTAEFYEDLTLPTSFTVTNKAPTWILPATTSAPTLSGGTGAISHTLKATWDCCAKGKKATKTTKIETR